MGHPSPSVSCPPFSVTGKDPPDTAAAAGTGSTGTLLRTLPVLFKLRIALTLLFCAVAAAVIASAGHVQAGLLLWLLLAGGLTAAGAGALNHLLDRDLDARMQRTARRPLPAGRISPVLALLLGVGTAAVGITVGGMALGGRVALVLAAGLMIYVGVYTLWLKRRTAWNIVIGGAAGSMMVLAGWLAVRPNLTPTGIVLPLLLFLWTPSHFWPLAIALRDQYAAAGVPMLPVTAGRRVAAAATAGNTALLLAASLLPGLWGMYGTGHMVALITTGGGFLYLTLQMAAPGGDRWAWLAYRLSGPYLALMLLVMMLAAV